MNEVNVDSIIDSIGKPTQNPSKKSHFYKGNNFFKEFVATN